MRLTFFDIMNYVLLIWNCGSELVLSPERTAKVEEGRPLTLTCESNETSGIYSFFYIDGYGNKVNYGLGGGSFRSCLNSTNQALMACEFGSHWIFRLTITHPVHNQTVYCSGAHSGQEWITNTTIFVEGDATLSVKHSSDVVVNQTITLQCLFRSGQFGVLFYFPGGIICVVEFVSCARGCGSSLSFECPNNQTYILNVTVLPSWHKTTFSCQPPFGGRRSEITLNVTVPVTSATIIGPNRTSLDSGTTMYLTCQTSYCHPPATITWYTNNMEISDHTIVTVDTNQYFLSRMTSKLQYSVMPRDNGENIYCIASNIPGESVVSNKTILDVRYISEVQILPVNSLYIVAETKQVWIYCHVKNANPEYISYRWTKSNYSLESTVVSSAQMYFIDSAVEKDMGKYTCIAMNSAGNSSGTVDIYVQSKPMKPTITLADCDVNNATILWTFSSPLNFQYIPPLQQETLQLSKQNDGFLNCSYEKLETNQSYVYVYRVTDLNPSTEYRFRFLASNGYGSSFSDSHICYTVEEVLISKSKDCDKGLIIGESLGGAFILVIFSGGFAFFINLQINRKKQQTADHYVHHFCSTTDHQYQDISTENKGAEKAAERAEYLELPDKIYTNDDMQ